MKLYRNLFFALLISSLFAAAQSQPPSSGRAHTAAYKSMSDKLDRIARNGMQSRPDPTPTRITADEASAWMNEGGVKLPNGVSQLRFRSTPGTITTNARVDFDQITASHRSGFNPLMALFSGVHDIEVVSNASGTNGTATINIDNLAIDGVNVPRMAMEYFVDKYLKPKYPNVGLDTQVHLPARVDSAVVGTNEVTVVQK